MASSSKIIIALLLAFAVVAATLSPSTAARAPRFIKTADESHQTPPAEPLLHPSTASIGSPATPGHGGLFPPLPGLGALLPPLFGAPESSPQPTECMTPLVSLFPCMGYLTNLTVLTPPDACCDGLRTLISDAPICLCHGMSGDLNKFLPAPVDPVRMVILPLACGALPPLQTLLSCSSSQVPPLMPPVQAVSASSPPPSSP